MTAQTAVCTYPSIMLDGTSGNGALQRPRDWFVCVPGIVTISGTASSEFRDQLNQGFAGSEPTNSGLPLSDATVTPSAIIGEIWRRSGLTWDQLARVFGVTRRSVHFWASGEKLNAAHQERLVRLLASIRYVDRGFAPDTRAALMTPLGDGVTPLDLLMRDELDEFDRRLGAGARRLAFFPGPLSASARAVRTPLPPTERVGALQDSVHRETGKTRVAKTAKVARER